MPRWTQGCPSVSGASAPAPMPRCHSGVGSVFDRHGQLLGTADGSLACERDHFLLIRRSGATRTKPHGSQFSETMAVASVRRRRRGT